MLTRIRSILGLTKSYTSAGPDYYNGDRAYWTDFFRNGWAAVSSALGALTRSLRDWGGTDYASLAADAASNPHSGRALRLISDNGAAVKVIAYKEATEDGDEDEADPLNPALQAIERTGWTRLWTPFVWGMYCGGEVFFRRLSPETGPNAGVPRVIQVLRNEKLHRINRDRDGEVTSYEFSRDSDRRAGVDEYPADEVLHVKLFNPEDEDRGLPMLVSARRALTLVAEADAWNRGVAKGGGRVPGYLVPNTRMLEMFQGQIPSDKVDEIQNQADGRTQERRDKNLPQVMSGAFEYQSASVTPREADWLKGRTVAMREIAAVMGVPATLLADEKAGSLTDAGVDSEVAALYKLTIQPLIHRLLMELTEWMAPEGTRLAADWDQVPALQEDIDAMFIRYGGLAVLTEKERRVALNYDPVPKPEMEDEAAAPMVEDEQPDEAEAVKALRDLPADFWASFNHESLGE